MEGMTNGGPDNSNNGLSHQNAVCVRYAEKTYGPKKNPNVILDGLNMTVPKGVIYGLLGASGCGKTTLLSCIVGRRRLNAGEIWVLGGQPGSRGSGVPGPRIGYMPQEIALYGEFTIRETFIYFGWMAGMKSRDIENRIQFYLKLMELPNSSRFVKTLSGGQQRRMSLAAALVHDPELLILDEPTVGLDPVVRENIWGHLVDLTKSGRKTFIITTHYIEETRQAKLIGLMRGGKLLAEESPDFLLQKYDSPSLEHVFLKLAVIQNKRKRSRPSISHKAVETGVTNKALEVSDEDFSDVCGEFGDNISLSSHQQDGPAPSPLPPQDPIPKKKLSDNFKILNTSHMKAMIWKNFIWMWRNFGIMAFNFGLPVAQILIFGLAIGRNPMGLKLAVANQELTQEMIQNQDCPFSLGCNYTYLSCRYLSYLQNNKSLVLSHFKSTDMANDEVRHGRAWGSISFASNYSDSYRNRRELGKEVDEVNLLLADINVHLDMTDQQISYLIYRDIQYAYLDFISDVLTDCGVDPRHEIIPVRFNTPIYGTNEPSFRDFAAPGIILTAVFFLSFALTAGAMLTERNGGMLERCLVSGSTAVEILFSHVISQFFIMIGQSALVLFFCFGVFEMTNNGDMVLVCMLTIVIGLCGMSFGFVISCAVDSERNATYMGMGSLLPMIMLSGIIWPIEGMYPGLRLFSYFLPLTKCTESLRKILQRGWNLSEMDVWIGFAAVSVWIMIFMTTSILVLKFKKG